MTDAWNIPGWTAQNPVYPADPVVVTTALPTNVTPVRVTADYVASNGGTLSGQVRFTPSIRRVTDGTTVISLVDVYAAVVNGVMEAHLLPTDDPDLSPTFTWHVREAFPGGTSFDIQVPSASADGVSIFSLPKGA